VGRLGCHSVTLGDGDGDGIAMKISLRPFVYLRVEMQSHVLPSVVKFSSAINERIYLARMRVITNHKDADIFSKRKINFITFSQTSTCIVYCHKD